MKHLTRALGDVLVLALFFSALIGLVALMCEMAWKGMPK